MQIDLLKNVYEENYTAYWLLTGVIGFPIDLNRMSTAAGRRDFPHGVSGSHMALNPYTCPIELKLKPNFQPDNYPSGSFLLKFQSNFKTSDIRSEDTAGFSGAFYGDNTLSHQIFVENSGVLANSDCNVIRRYSAPLLQEQKYEDVLALLGSARAKLNLIGILSLNKEYSDPGVIPFGGTNPVPISNYPPFEV